MNVEDFLQWELKVEANKKQNHKMLQLFEAWLITDGELKLNTEHHLFNATIFANTFLTTEEVIPLAKGLHHIEEYFSNFFIINAPIANKETLLQNLKSIELLYTFMHISNLISDQGFNSLTEMMSTHKQSWIDRCEIYHSGCEF